MSKPTLTQTELYNVLVSEVESLKATKGEYTKLLGGISENLKRLEELYNKPISLDIEEMRREHERIKSTLAKGLYIPKWLAISFPSLILVMGISLFFNYRQYVSTNKQYRYIEWLESKLESQLEKEISKSNPWK